MRKPEHDICGCAGAKPASERALDRLARLVELAEERERQRKEAEQRKEVEGAAAD